MKNNSNISKEAGILLITIVMVLSTLTITVHADEINENTPQTSNVKESTPTSLDTFSEGFEGGAIPAGWLNVDDDGDGHRWEIKDSLFSAPHSGDYFIASASFTYETGPLTPDNWLITPALKVSDISELTFWVAAFNDVFAEDHLEVWISTTGTDITDFTDEVDSYTIPEGDMNYTMRTVDLSSYDGETVYIAFRHCDCTNQWWIKLDDINITGVTIPEPDLGCDGSLSWTNIGPGATITGEFTVENVGDSGSGLDWEISEYPDWGTWTFSPSSGNDLSPEDGVKTVSAEVVAPDEENQDFSGEVKIVNSEDPDDYCIIDVSLSTPVNHYSMILQFLEILFEHSPWAFPILRYMFGL